jgi:copper chaperone NosL
MKQIGLLLAFCLIFGCSKTPEAIKYGSDMCQYCKMTIVTKTHAAQIVTSKGKQFKFDAIECMIRFLEDKQDLIENSNLLVTNYNNPGVMTDAKSASYVISEQISSPMGANLTGFNSLEEAKRTINDDSSEYYDWDGIFKKLN